MVLYIDEVDDRLIAAPTLCGRWDCWKCGPMRLRRARALAVAGKPERIITLTTRPKPDWSTEASVKWFRRRWSLLLARIRRTFGAFEYMQVTELHKSQWPHLHILTRGCYIPQRMLSAWWLELTGSFKVHIQKVDNSWKGVQEATKYCLKTARALHEAAPHIPVYTKSRGWSLDKDDDERRPAGGYTFYCYVPYAWRYFREVLDSLDCETEADPAAPGRVHVTSRSPPRQSFLDLIYSAGTYPDMVAVSAGNAFFSVDSREDLNVPDLQARVDFVAGHHTPYLDVPAPDASCDRGSPDRQQAFTDSADAPWTRRALD